MPALQHFTTSLITAVLNQHTIEGQGLPKSKRAQIGREWLATLNLAAAAASVAVTIFSLKEFWATPHVREYRNIIVYHPLGLAFIQVENLQDEQTILNTLSPPGDDDKSRSVELVVPRHDYRVWKDLEKLLLGIISTQKKHGHFDMAWKIVLVDIPYAAASLGREVNELHIWICRNRGHGCGQGQSRESETTLLTTVSSSEPDVTETAWHTATDHSALSTISTISEEFHVDQLELQDNTDLSSLDLSDCDSTSDESMQDLSASQPDEDDEIEGLKNRIQGLKNDLLVSFLQLEKAQGGL